MLLKECKGYELTKAKPNTSEDYFNRSEVIFVDEGEEKVLHVLYVRYFEELFPQFTPYEQDPVFTIGTKEIQFKDIVGLVCLLKNPSLRKQKRVYINNENEFKAYFKDTNFEMIKEVFHSLEQNNGYELQ